MTNYEFANPWFLLLLLIIPLIMIWNLAFKNKSAKSIQFPSVAPFKEDNHYFRWIPPFLSFLKYTAFSLMIVALARPRKVDVSTEVKSDKGIDIMMVVDVSLSMMARDLKPNRIAALQEVAENFVIKRTSDRIGLVVYSGNAITKVPLTTDRAVVINSLRNLKMDELAPGTAIGVGLATAINHLEHSKAKSKVVLLITDGGESEPSYENGIYISPEDAALIAQEKGIKVYTIGIGSTGFIPLPRGYEHYPQSLFQLDENLLKYIAQTANGTYFRATDNVKLENIYDEINQLEKTEVNNIKYYSYTEYYRPFLIWAFICLSVVILINTLIFKSIT